MLKQGSWTRRLCVCLLNISEARNPEKVQAVARAALLVNEGSTDRLKSSVLNIFSDHDYNRSVITIAGHVDNLGKSIVSACKKAFDEIDLSEHVGGHPRLGAVDLIPIHPLSADVTLEECGKIATDIARELAENVEGSSFFLFGTSDVPEGRGLVRRRKDVRWFKGCHGSGYHGNSADVGAQPGPRRGLTGIGAIPYIMNCNVTIATENHRLGQSIAAALRATSPGGLPGVQAMAFPHEGQVEVACNVQGVYIDEGDIIDPNLSCSFGRCYHIPARVIEQRVGEMAGREGVDMVGTATIIGFTPEEARRLAAQALQSGVGEFWKTRKVVTM